MKVRLATLGIAGLLALGIAAQRAGAGNPCNPPSCAAVIDQCIAEDGCDAMSGHDKAACRNACSKGVRVSCFMSFVLSLKKGRRRVRRRTHPLLLRSLTLMRIWNLG